MKKWFLVAITLICISIISNAVYYEAKQLEEPLVINSYQKIRTYEATDTSITLYYLSNKKDNIEIDGLQTSKAFYTNKHRTDFELSYYKEFTHHYLKEASFDIPYSETKHVEEEFKNNRIYIRFSNGTQRVLKLDHLSFQENTQVFHNRSGAGYNLSTVYDFISTDQDAKMEEFHLPEAIQDNIQVKIKVWTNKREQYKEIDEVNKDMKKLNAPLSTELTEPIELNAGGAVGFYIHTEENPTVLKYINIFQE